MPQTRPPFSRPTLKVGAKQAMAHYSPKIYFITLLYLVIQYLPSLVNDFNLPTFTGDVEDYIWQLSMQMYSSIGRGWLLWLVTVLLQVFLTLISYGYIHYAMKVSRGEECGAADLFYCFSQFGRFFLAYLLMGIFTILWSCLLIVPGIIAMYSYTQVIYLMLDDPTLTPMQAIRRSKELMRGHKWEYFVLQLSFYGWALLSAVTFNILNIWLQPYMDVTYAGYYNWLIGWQPESQEPQPLPNDGNPPPEDNGRWWEEQ